jgi:L-ascorbate metabolism protein UlaG (beta-lactamase superfamily)
MRRLFTTLVAIGLSGCGFFAQTRPARHAHPVAPLVADPDTTSIGITWIGHATVLIRLGDRWFLTDPVLGDRIGMNLYPRSLAAGIDVADLPALDAILISHAHMDHLDVPSLRRLPDVPLVATPPGAARYLPEIRGELAALDTWQRWTDGEVTITAVPASHGNGRWGIDRWVTHSHTGWVIEYRDFTVYFAGDTGFSRRQSEAIDARFDIDVALIPVGPAGRHPWIERIRRTVHANPREAMELFAACGAQWMVPIHFGTFFKPADFERPFVERAVAAHERGRFVRILDVGDTTEFLY